jgi:hypothetical protein
MGGNENKVQEIHAILSDGSKVVLTKLLLMRLSEKTRKYALSTIYKSLYEELSNVENQKKLSKNFQNQIHRRNTGYSVDLLLQSELLVDQKTI